MPTSQNVACLLGVLSFGYSARLFMQCDLNGSRLPFTAATHIVFDCCIGCAALPPWAAPTCSSWASRAAPW
eukprot:7150491-Alexandrium_andersonii.AAC.1